MSNLKKLKIRKDKGMVLQYNPAERIISVYNKNKQLSSFKDFCPDSIISPVRAVIDIAGSCNANCSYCSQKYKPIDPDMPADKLYKLIDELNEMEVFELTLRGGEALTHPKFSEVWDHSCKQAFLSTNAITNGMLLTSDKVKSMLQKPTSKIIISLDGLESTNSKYRDPRQYNLVMDWLPKFLPNQQDQFVILSTLYNENYNEMPDFARFLATIGIKHHHITTLKRIGETEFKQGSFVTPKELSSLENSLEKIKEEFPNYDFMISCRYTTKRVRKLIKEISLPFFTDYYSGTGLKITSNGSIGISKMVFFTNFFKKIIGKKQSVSLEPLGNIYDKNFSSVRKVWDENLELRIAQSEIINKNYEYFIGLKSIDYIL